MPMVVKLLWLLTRPILEQFDGKDKHRAYREKVQQYADEEKRLWEDFRHGMIIGTKAFVDKIRSKYMPDHIHKEIPQQRSLGKSVEPEKVLEKAAGILNCDLDDIRRSRRIPKSIKDHRDLLLYLRRNINNIAPALGLKINFPGNHHSKPPAGNSLMPTPSNA